MEKGKMPPELLTPPLKEAVELGGSVASNLGVIKRITRLGTSEIAERLGVADSNICNWQKGVSNPRQPVIIMAVGLWAKDLRAYQQSQSQRR